MFDSLFFPCMFCGAEIEAQTKSGPCLLDNYYMEAKLPLWLMEDLNGSVGNCPKCKKPQKLIFDLEIKIKTKEIIPVENLDYIEWLAKKRNIIE